MIEMEFMGIDVLMWIMMPVGIGVLGSLIRDAAQALKNHFATHNPEDHS